MADLEWVFKALCFWTLSLFSLGSLGGLGCGRPSPPPSNLTLTEAESKAKLEERLNKSLVVRMQLDRIRHALRPVEYILLDMTHVLKRISDFIEKNTASPAIPADTPEAIQEIADTELPTYYLRQAVIQVREVLQRLSTTTVDQETPEKWNIQFSDFSFVAEGNRKDDFELIEIRNKTFPNSTAEPSLHFLPESEKNPQTLMKTKIFFSNTQHPLDPENRPKIETTFYPYLFQKKLLLDFSVLDCTLILEFEQETRYESQRLTCKGVPQALANGTKKEAEVLFQFVQKQQDRAADLFLALKQSENKLLTKLQSLHLSKKLGEDSKIGAIWK